MRHISGNRTRRGQGAGFTLMEIVLALTIFTMMTLMFAAVFPIAVRGAQFSNYYNQATLLGQHKIDQIRSAGFSVLQDPTGSQSTSTSSLVSRNIIDSNSLSGSTVPYTAAFTAIDNLASSGTVQGLFPAGSTGTLSVVDYHTLNAAVPANKVDYVTVTINWSGAGLSTGSYQVSAVVIAMTHR